MKNILVLGGSSFIGFPVLNRLMQHHDFRIITTYHDHKPTLSGVKWEHLDIFTDDFLQFLEKHKPEIIVNCVALGDVDLCEKNQDLCYNVNVNPTTLIIEYCQKNPTTKYIFFSSSQVFDGKQKNPYKESDPANPINNYGESKAECEKIIVKNLAHYAIIRPCVVFGVPLSFQHRNVFNHIYKGLTMGEKVTGYADMIRNPCYVEDIPLMVEKIVKQEKNGIFHAGGEVMSMYDFAVKIAQFFGFDTQLIIKQKSQEQNRPKNNALQCESTKRELGITFKSLSDSLADIKNKVGVVS